MDHTTIHPMSTDQAHRVDLHLWRGAPRNHDASRPIQILVNQGYVVGFCPERLQPAWSAYRVAHADQDVDYDRPLRYYDDLRLVEEHRIGNNTFGKIGGIQLHVGHMSPNEVINRQFGRLAQMETFLMSNMSPQYGTLNGGVWLKLEDAIREIEDESGKDHMWVIVGPVFGDQPAAVNRGSGKHVPVPEAYFCVTVDPFQYPYDTPSKVHIDCFIIPQDAPSSSSPQDYPATLAEVEQATNLEFFEGWGRDHPVAMQMQQEGPSSSRLMQILDRKEQEWQAQHLAEVAEAKPVADTLAGLIEALEAEAAALQAVGRPLTESEEIRLKTIQHTISWLLAASELIDEPRKPAKPGNLITYNIVDDLDGRLKQAARIACNFWNRFLEPADSIVIRLGIFTQTSNTIARAYMPYANDGVRYGRVEFNTRFLVDFSGEETAATIIHEIGHTLGMGWDDWDKLFHANTGKFKQTAVRKLAALADMEVEREGGPGTALSHWDEALFDKELMTGYKDSGEFVLPVTIDLMALLGHNVVERLEETTDLAMLMADVANMVFSRQDEARRLDLEYFEETDIFETIPHPTEEDGEA